MILGMVVAWATERKEVRRVKARSGNPKAGGCLRNPAPSLLNVMWHPVQKECTDYMIDTIFQIITSHKK